jgi:hypothetical protein
MTPSQIRTLVLNGTQRVGLAAHVSAALAKRGFAIQRLERSWVANAPEPAYLTTIYFDPSQSKARVAALVLRDRLEPRTVVRASTKLISRLARRAGRPLLVLVLGSSFQGLSQ